MALWTTYLSFISRNKKDILKRLGCTSQDHGLRIHYVMRNRGNNEVAPSKELLAAAKGRKITWEEYQRYYLIGIQVHPDALEFMFNAAIESKKHEVVLVCFEKDYKHCHRYLLAQEITREFPDVVYKGELNLAEV